MSDETVREQATLLFNKLQDQHWSIFFRDVFGLNGIIYKAYPTKEELYRFKQTSAYQDILCMLSNLWEEPNRTSGERRAVITLRLPQSFHDLLKEEAHDMRTTINALCIAKLTLNISPDMVPKIV
jgi:predicted HicB family RNase H-like nuclease